MLEMKYTVKIEISKENIKNMFLPLFVEQSQIKFKIRHIS